MKDIFCSIIIPVLNETSITDTLQRLEKIDGTFEKEVIVVDGGPGARTLKTITAKTVRKLKSPRGRGRQMNEGAKEAKGDILLFLHADTGLPVNALALIDRAMRDRSIVAGAFDLGIASKRFPFRIIERVASVRSRFTRIPFGDQAIFIRRDYFGKIGGYKDLPVMEDVEIMKRIRRRGGRIVIIGERVMTSPRRWEKEGILRCTVRNWLLQVLYPLGVPARTLARLYKPDA